MSNEELKATIQDIHDSVYEQGVRDFTKYLIDKHVDNYSDIVDLVGDFLKGK